MLANFFVPILHDGWRFIAIFAGDHLRRGADRRGVAVLAAVRADAWSIYFFRDPSRGVPQDDGVLVAPADGLVQMVVDAVPPAELGLGRAAADAGVDLPQRVRCPHQPHALRRHRRRRGLSAGQVPQRRGRQGERGQRAHGDRAAACRRPRRSAVVQIAGWVARRIVCYIKPGQAVAAGERFGHIRFGSRTDLYLPAGARLLVATGQRMIGGETVMAELDAGHGATPRAASSSRTIAGTNRSSHGQRFSHAPQPVARLLDQPADPQRADAGGAVLGPDGDPLRRCRAS